MALEIPFTDANAVSDLEHLLDPPEAEIALGGKKLRLATAKKVGQAGGLRINIFVRGHPPPHFQVNFQGESANYRISDGQRLTRGLERYDGEIRAWHQANKQKLIDEWDNTRPADCPVGKYREGGPTAGEVRGDKT